MLQCGDTDQYVYVHLGADAEPVRRIAEPPKKAMYAARQDWALSLDRA